MIVYALNNKKDALHSSSGGAFLFFAKTIITTFPKAKVYGVKFDSNMNLVYQSAQSIDECFQFCGSKYIHTTPNNVFREIVEDLKKNTKVLFIGTPCNIYALVSYLAKENVETDSLFTIDLICNGAPSKQFWISYVDWIQSYYKDRLIDFSFRKKGDAHNPYLTEAVFENRIIKDTHVTASYNQVFLKKLSIRKGCFSCGFKSLDRCGDITIGDFWGIEELMPSFDNKNGVSEVIVNNAKGLELFNLAKNNLENADVLIEECKDKRFIDYQDNLKSAKPKPPQYDRFNDDYNKYGMRYVMSHYADGDSVGAMRYFLKRISRNIGLTARMKSLLKVRKR